MNAISHAILAPMDTPHTFVVEASTIGLAPGQWPTQLPVEANVGNGRPLVRLHYSADVMFYRQQFGCITVHVLND